jgi:hypothetical protein
MEADPVMPSDGRFLAFIARPAAAKAVRIKAVMMIME